MSVEGYILSVCQDLRICPGHGCPIEAVHVTSRRIVEQCHLCLISRRRRLTGVRAMARIKRRLGMVTA